MKKFKKSSSQIDMSSLMDIIFILLIFVMMSISFSKSYKSISISVPKSENGSSKLEENFKISMNDKKEIFLDSEKIELNELKKIAINGKLNEKNIRLYIDKKIEYQEFVKLLDAIKIANLKNIQLATE